MSARSTSSSALDAIALTALRVVAGGMLSFHGMQKLFGWLSKGPSPATFSQMWFGGVIELTCGVLVALGLFTRPAAFLASGTMAVAYFQFHFKLDFANYHWLPGVNAGELAVIYCFVFLLFAVRGGGPYALDARR